MCTSQKYKLTRVKINLLKISKITHLKLLKARPKKIQKTKVFTICQKLKGQVLFKVLKNSIFGLRV